MKEHRSHERVHAVVKTPLGWVAVLATERGVRALTLPRKTREAALERLMENERDIGVEDPARLRPLLERLRAFYSGQPVTFDDITLDLEGFPPFYVQVWQRTRTVAWGETITYGELAAEVGKPGAARAVGQAMAHNPVPPIVPCHRVVARGGRLGGYGGGLDMKARLLAMEGRHGGY